jgi:hypothetical protein
MYAISCFINPILNNQTITLQKSLAGLMLWVIFGLIFGYFYKWYYGRKKKNNQEKEN